MDARLELAATLPPDKGMRGAMSTILDVQRYKRAGFITSHSAPTIVRLVMAARMDEQRATGRATGHANRARRRILAMIDAAQARILAAQRRRHADIAHDTATEGYARRPFRINPHD